MGRRVTVLAVAAVLALVAASGAALADNVRGDAAGNRLAGTEGKDNISGAGGADDIFGKGGRDRLFGDAGNDDVSGGDQGDRLQAGTGQDDLFGQQDDDFLNVIDGQTNDSVDCGEGENDVAGIDGFFFNDDSDDVSPNCENLYVAVPGGGSWVRGGAPATDLSSVDTVEEAERAEAAGLLRQVK